MTPRTQDRLALVLLVLVTALVVELVRSSGPLLDHAFAAGIATVALTALATYAAPGVFVVLLAARLEITGKVVLFAVASLVVARLALQWLGTAVAGGSNLGLLRYGIGLAAVALGIGVLVVVAAFVSGVAEAPDDSSARSDGARVALGLTLGALGAGALSALLGTWDAYWRGDVPAWAVTLLLGVAALACAWRVRGRAAWPGARGLWVVGPFLALAVQVLANPAFVASQAGVAVPFAVAALAAAALLAAWFVPWAAGVRERGPRARGRALGLLTGPWLAPLLLVAGVAVTFLLVPRVEGPGDVAGWALLVLLTLLVPAAAHTVALALTGTARPVTWLRLAGAASVAGLGIAIPLLGYQIDYDVPLPFANGWVPVAAAVAVALPAVLVGRRRAGAAGAHAAAHASSGTERMATATSPSLRVGTPLALGGAVAVLALVGMTQVHVPAGPQDVSYAQAPLRLTVLDWNLHYGVSADPSVRLDEMVSTIAESGADVVTLQEVSRGWVLGGGSDMATYLARETGMRVVFVPAADRQFGNAILWDPAAGGLDDVVLHALPYGVGPQERSAISATSDAAGLGVRVTSVHLQHREDSTPTRLDQLDALFAAEPVEGPYVLAGDLNAEPGWEEITLVEDQGLTSGQDTAGNPEDLTSPSIAPAHRIDWVLGSDQVTFRTFEVLDVTASDHRPLLTEIRLAP
ncbi:endonuclease/exonuclease/phosphatase family protein [Cellulosimicrobium terreum]|nr:endonuclease/exonuclease/phosphatase family protein [Cellulosimicrobium terreum]